MINTLLILVAIIFATLRFGGQKSQTFQALSHLFVGGLIGAFLVGHGPLLLILSIALSVVEVVAFLHFKAQAYPRN